MNFCWLKALNVEFVREIDKKYIIDIQIIDCNIAKRFRISINKFYQCNCKITTFFTKVPKSDIKVLYVPLNSKLYLGNLYMNNSQIAIL